jgi:hypothetical protein
MLRTPARPATAATRIAVAVAFLSALLIGFASQPAVADPDDPDCWDGSSGTLVYICQSEDPADLGNPGNSGPQCDLSRVIGYGVAEFAQYWCEGQNACWANIPSAVYGAGGPDGEEPPTERSVYIYKICYDPAGELIPGLDWMWFEPPEPPIGLLAQLAYGELATPSFTLAFNPPTRSYVTIDTWWWADGAGDGDITGSSALGVVAIGEPDYIEVNPGDGSGTFQCPWTTSQSDSCTYTYERASVNGSTTAADGSPAYAAEARLVYSVRFERFGAPIDLPGLPDSLEGPWESTPVPVAEIQATVIG